MHLMEGPRLRKLEVEFHFPVQSSERVYRKAMYPPQRLRRVQQVKILSNTGEHQAVLTRVSADMQCFELAFNTLKHGQFLLREIGSLLDRANYLYANDCQEGPQLYAKEAGCLRQVYGAQTYVCVSSKAAESFQADLDDHQRELEYFDAGFLKTRARFFHRQQHGPDDWP